MHTFYYYGFDIGQHVEILLICYCIMDLIVVNILETPPMFALALDSRVVNMLRVYEFVVLCWVRVWSTC